MSRRPDTHLTVAQSAQSVRTYLFVDGDLPKRIDDHIDYFGSGAARRSIASRDQCGESLLDADGAR
jgi:hypothetical protein